MKKEKNKSGLIVLVIILLILVLGLGGYILYDRVFSDENINNNNNSNRKLTQADLENLLNEEIHNLLISKRSLSEITNIEKLELLISDYKGSLSNEERENLEEIKKSDLEKLIPIHILDMSNLKYESIPCFLNDHNSWTYDEDTETFNYTDIGHGIGGPNILSKKTSDFSKEDDKYTISVKYIWSGADDYGLADNPKIYGTYNDAINSYTTGVAIYDFVDWEIAINATDDELLKILEDNIDKLETYNYVFQYNEDGILKLVDFYVESI